MIHVLRVDNVAARRDGVKLNRAAADRARACTRADGRFRGNGRKGRLHLIHVLREDGIVGYQRRPEDDVVIERRLGGSRVDRRHFRKAQLASPGVTNAGLHHVNDAIRARATSNHKLGTLHALQESRICADERRGR
jgi:hypothetical protein